MKRIRFVLGVLSLEQGELSGTRAPDPTPLYQPLRGKKDILTTLVEKFFESETIRQELRVCLK